MAITFSSNLTIVLMQKWEHEHRDILMGAAWMRDGQRDVPTVGCCVV